MKKILILLLFIPLFSFSQYEKMKFNYRESPKNGEIVCITGVALIAMSATGLLNQGNDLKLSKTVGYIGGGLVFAGVVIDLNRNDKRFSYRHKFKKNRIRLKF